MKLLIIFLKMKMKGRGIKDLLFVYNKKMKREAAESGGMAKSVAHARNYALSDKLKASVRILRIDLHRLLIPSSL